MEFLKRFFLKITGHQEQLKSREEILNELISAEKAPELIEEAARNPNGWVFIKNGEFAADEEVPHKAIIGAWKVDEHGQITDVFEDNPSFVPEHEAEVYY